MSTEVAQASTNVDASDQARADLETIARIASHDLKEPLRMIESFTGLIVEEAGEHASPELSLYGSHIVGATRRMRRMVENLLSISRLQGPLRMSSVDLNEVLRRVRGDALRARPDARIDVHDLPSVHGHALYLSVCFANAVDNALRFNRSEVPSVEVRAERAGRAWSIQLVDNGVGIGAEDLERVCEMFVRVDEVLDGVPGTGIGLAVALRIARAHGGDLSLMSAPGEGTTVSILLPGEDDVE